MFSEHFMSVLFNSDCYSFFSEYDQPHESQTNKDIVETIHRKGLGEGPGKQPLKTFSTTFEPQSIPI
jgi:hypothetical protein